MCMTHSPIWGENIYKFSSKYSSRAVVFISSLGFDFSFRDALLFSVFICSCNVFSQFENP